MRNGLSKMLLGCIVSFAVGVLTGILLTLAVWFAA